ncbi:MAG: IS1634 family transposase, partial [Planctomycetota bacterium]
VGRVVYQGSKLALTNLWKDTALWSLCGLGEDRPEVDECYEAMDRLLERQPAIQEALAKRHLKKGCLVLYDVTSSYFEGEYQGSELVDYGYNRDGKRRHPQIVIGLLTAGTGCPVGVSVYRGNTNDQTTLADRVQELKESYDLCEVILAGDRGMLTKARLAEVSAAGMRSVTALTHPQMWELVHRKVIAPSLFDERNIAEITEPNDPSVRYLLCLNPLTAEKERKTRLALIEKTREALAQLTRSRKKRTPEQIGAVVGQALAKWKVGKFFAWRVCGGKLEWSLEEFKVQQEESLDGCYVVRTDASREVLDRTQAVGAYRQLALVDRAFRQLKTVALEIRPVYHHLDQRIEAHVFLCMLAYYVQWHMQQKLAPLFAADGSGEDRRWTWAGVLERLKGIRRQTVTMKGTAVTLTSRPDDEQEELLKLLEVAP